MRSLCLIPLCLLIIPLLAACQPASDSGAERLGTPALIPVSSPGVPPRQTESVFDDPALEKIIKLVKERLAKKLNIATDQVMLRGAAAMTWPDAGLGCPDQGIVYVPRDTPGYSLILEAGGLTYIYHTDAVFAVVLCDIR